jgi:nascent polypeptide-associated complex subunit alpha
MPLDHLTKGTEATSAPTGPVIPEEDVQLVMSQTGTTREKAMAALKACDGQPAEAIIKLISS